MTIMNTAISEDELQYLNIFEAASDGMVVIDLVTGKVLAANPAAAAMHGLTREAFIGSSLQKFIHTKSLPLFDNFEQVIRKNDIFEGVLQHVRS